MNVKVTAILAATLGLSLAADPSGGCKSFVCLFFCSMFLFPACCECCALSSANLYNFSNLENLENLLILLPLLSSTFIYVS